MQRVKHYDLPHPFSIHLGPKEALRSAVKLEFSVERIPYMPDPKVSCYERNGCIVYEGYCPIGTKNPFSHCGIRNIKTGSKQQQDSAWSKESGGAQAPYNPFVLWDVIPRLIQDIINGPNVKVMNMDDKKLSPGSNMREAPEKPSGSGFQKDSFSFGSAKEWDEIQNVDQMRDQRALFGSERERHTMIFPLISGVGNSGSDELSIANDPFEKRQWQTVGNIVEPNEAVAKPVITDNIATGSSEALSDAADLVTQRRWDRREAQPVMPTVLPRRDTSKIAVPKEDRMSAVLSKYTKSVPMQHRHEEDPEAVSISISWTDSGEVEVDLSDADANISREWSMSHADAACGTGRIDREASQCVLCGSLLHRRKERHDQKLHSATGQPPRTMKDVSTHTSTTEPIQRPKEKSTTTERKQRPKEKSRTTEPIQRPKEKSIRRESIAHPVENNQGEAQSASTAVVSTLVSTAGDKQQSQEQTITAYPVVTSQVRSSRTTTFPPAHASVAEYEEKHPRQEITEHPVRASKTRTFPPLHASVAEYEEKHPTQEITEHPGRSLRAAINVGSSTEEETEMPRRTHAENPRTLVNDQNVAVYAVNRKSSSPLRKSVRANKEDDQKQCTLQHVVFPREKCPYTPSLTSLPLDESDIEYIIQRAQLAKAALPADMSLCPTERWQHRGHRRSTSAHKSRSRSTG